MKNKKQFVSALVMSGILGAGVIAGDVVPVHAAGEITVEANTLKNEWLNETPKSIGRGGNLTAEYKLNLNTTDGKKGGAERKVVLRAQNGKFHDLPASADPDKSSVSKDGKTMTLVIKEKLGTSVHFNVDVFASGGRGDKVTITTEYQGKSNKLPEVPIVTTSGIDVKADWKHLYSGLPSGSGGTDYTASRRAGFNITTPVGSDKINPRIEFDVQLSSDNNPWLLENDILTIENYLDPGLVRDRVSEDELPNGGFRGSPGPESEWNRGTDSLKDVKIDFKGNGLYHVSMNVPEDPAEQARLGAIGSEDRQNRDRIYIAGGEFRTKYKVKDAQEGAKDRNLIALDLKVLNLKAEDAYGKPFTEDSFENNEYTDVRTFVGSESAGWDTLGQYRLRSLNNSDNEALGDGTFQLGKPLTENYDGNFIEGGGLRWTGEHRVVPGSTVLHMSNITPFTRDSRVVLLDADTPAEYTGRGAVNLNGVDKKSIKVYYTTDKVDPNKIDGTDLHKTVNWSTKKPSSGIRGIRIDWDPVDRDEFFNKYGGNGWSGLAEFEVKVNNDAKVGDELWAYATARSAGEENFSTVFTNPTVSDLPGTRYGKTRARLDYLGVASSRVRSTTTAEVDEVDVREEFDVKVTGNIEQGKDYDSKIALTTTLPKGVEYVSAEGKPKVEKNDDGTTTIKWDNLSTRDKSKYEFNVRVRATGEGRSTAGYRIATTIDNLSTTPGDWPNSRQHTSAKRVQVKLQGSTNVEKTVRHEQQYAGDKQSNTWKNTVTNRDFRTQDIVDVIDVLPYEGDGRGTKLSSSYHIGNVDTPGNAEKTTVYYTTADPKKLSADPSDASNGGMGKPSKIWSKERPADAKSITGVRMVAENLPVAGTVNMNIHWAPGSGSKPGDKYGNFVGARATHTELLMLSSSNSTVVKDKGHVKIDKVIHKSSVLKPGGLVRYSVKLTNTGKGTVYNYVANEHGGAGLQPDSIKFENPSQGTVRGTNWRVGDIPAGKTVTADVVARVITEKDKDYSNSLVIRNRVDGQRNYENPPDPSKCNELDNCDTTVNKEESKLRVFKEVVNAKSVSGEPGDTITYKVTVKNDAVAKDGVITTARDVLVRDLGGKGIENVKLTSPSKGTINAKGEWVVGDLKAGETHTVTVTAKNVADPKVKEVTNKVVVENPPNPPKNDTPGQPCDPKDEQCDEVTLKKTAKLKIDKTRVHNEKSSGEPGDKTEYVITVKNPTKEADGTISTAHKVKVKDIPIAGLKNPVFSKPSKGAVKNGEWEVGSLAPGETATIHVTATNVDDVKNVLTNKATVESPGLPVDPEKCEANNGVDKDTDQCDTDTTKLTSRVQIDKKLNSLVNASGEPGDRNFYTITVKNPAKEVDGTIATAHNVKVKDLPGAGLTDPKFTKPSKGEVKNGEWLVGSLKPGETATIQVSAKNVPAVRNGSELVNTATVETPRLPVDPKKCKANGTVDTDDDQCDHVSVKANTNLKVDKVLTNAETLTANPGDKPVYRVVVKNDLPEDATGITTAHHVVMQDLGGYGLTNVKILDVDHGKVDPEDPQKWNIGSLKKGEEAVATVEAEHTEVAKEGTQNYVIVHSPSNPFDPTPDDGKPFDPKEDFDPTKKDSLTCQTTEQVGDDEDQCDMVEVNNDAKLQVDKTITNLDKISGTPGEKVEYLVTVQNSAKKSDKNVTLARDVVAKDLPGVGLDKIVLEKPSKGEIKDGEWQVGELKPGEKATIRVVGEATADAAKEIRNKVTVESPGSPVDPEKCEVNPDVDGDTDQCDEVVVSNGLNLQIDKKLEGKDKVKPGDTVKYRITAKNGSKKPEGEELSYTLAKEVMVKDLAGKGLKDVKLSKPSKGSLDGENWNIGELKPGETVTVEVTGVIDKKDKGGVINTAVIGNNVRPMPDGGKCEANDNVDGDNDQCDNVSVNVVPDPPKAGEKPAPEKPDSPEKKDPGADAKTGGDTAPVLPLVAGGLLLAVAGASVFLWRRLQK